MYLETRQSTDRLGVEIYSMNSKLTWWHALWHTDYRQTQYASIHLRLFCHYPRGPDKSLHHSQSLGAGHVLRSETTCTQTCFLWICSGSTEQIEIRSFFSIDRAVNRDKKKKILVAACHRDVQKEEEKKPKLAYINCMLFKSARQPEVIKIRSKTETLSQLTFLHPYHGNPPVH